MPEYLLFGDSVTTDHISPAGNIQEDSPAGLYLLTGRLIKNFNSYGSRRGNHEIMMRGTFAILELKMKFYLKLKAVLQNHSFRIKRCQFTMLHKNI